MMSGSQELRFRQQTLNPTNSHPTRVFCSHHPLVFCNGCTTGAKIIAAQHRNPSCCRRWYVYCEHHSTTQFCDRTLSSLHVVCCLQRCSQYSQLGSYRLKSHLANFEIPEANSTIVSFFFFLGQIQKGQKNEEEEEEEISLHSMICCTRNRFIKYYVELRSNFALWDYKILTNYEQ
jgi:hypothetical protein